MHQKTLKKRNLRKTGFIIYCILPSMLLYLVFMIIPTLQVFSNSIYSWSGLSPVKDFIGLNNYKTLIHDKILWTSFGNTIKIMLTVTIITMTISLALAYSLTRTRLKEKDFYRTIFFFPNVLSFVVIGILFKNIFAPSTGILNSLLSSIGLDSLTHVWLGEPSTVLGAISTAMIWQAFGYYMVMYIAGMDSISPEMYEAAKIEGASPFQQFFYITIPLMWRIIRVTLVFFIASTLNTSFLTVTVMTNGGPNYRSEVLLSYMYRQAFINSNFGYAMTIAVFVFVFALALALLISFITKEKD